MRPRQCDEGEQSVCGSPVRLRAAAGVRGRALAAVVAGVILAPGMVLAEVQAVTQTGGPPVLPVPTYLETGLPSYTMPVGTPSDLPPADPSAGGDGGGGGGGGDGSTGSPALDTMLSRSWGAAAQANAEALGVNGTALAATCVLESNCQNVGGAGTINGAFQMSNGTYAASMAAALAQDPGLAASIVSGLAGKSDPATQSIAASEYLRQGAQYLQARGVSNPTVLDVRGYYNFGPGNAVAIAQANDSHLMSDQITGLTAAQLVANGIQPGSTTVGQWRASVANKIGQSAAQASVLLAH